MTIALFWLSLFLIGYVYAGYPMVAWLRGHLRAKACARANIHPRVTVIVVAYNEATRIERRIENLLGSKYPLDKIEIVIASDGSTDDTADRAERYEGRGVNVRRFHERRGKAAVLNDLVPAAAGDVVIFADARQRFEPDAISTLVADFADASVGAVSGELVLRKRKGEGGSGAGFYWRYEKFIRANESWSGSTVGTTGAIYAIRRELFEPIPEDTILDDVLIPVRIARKGYRVLFEAEARANDWMPPAPAVELARKARTIAGTFQLFAREAWLMNPLRSPLWFEALSHKGLRLVVPALHLALFVANLALMHVWFYRGVMAAQLIFYAAALAGSGLGRARKRPMIFAVPYTMCLMLWATMIGFMRFVTHRQRATWERVAANEYI